MGNNLLHCCTDKTAQLLTDPPPRIEQPKHSALKRPSFSSSSGLYKDLRSYETTHSAVLNPAAATQEVDTFLFDEESHLQVEEVEVGVTAGECMQYSGAVTCCVALRGEKGSMAVAMEEGLIVIGDRKTEVK